MNSFKTILQTNAISVSSGGFTYKDIAVTMVVQHLLIQNKHSKYLLFDSSHPIIAYMRQ